MARDNDRRRAYRAEWALWSENNLEAIRMETTAEMQEFVNNLYENEEFKEEMWPYSKYAPLVVYPSRRRSVSVAEIRKTPPEIHLSPNGASNTLVLIHEIAHCVNNSSLPSHGLQWRSNFYKATKIAFDESLADRLAKKLAEQGLSVTLTGKEIRRVRKQITRSIRKESRLPYTRAFQMVLRDGDVRIGNARLHDEGVVFGEKLYKTEDIAQFRMV